MTAPTSTQRYLIDAAARDSLIYRDGVFFLDGDPLPLADAKQARGLVFAGLLVRDNQLIQPTAAGHAAIASFR